MRGAYLAATFLALTGLTAALPGAPAAPTGLVADIVALLGHEPAQVTIITHTPDGEVRRTVAWAELRARLQGGAGTDALPGIGCVVVPFCPDAATASPGFPPYCDTLSAWVAYVGEEAGLTYTQLEGTPSSVVTCGGFYGRTYDWSLVEMSPLPAAPEVEFDGCYAPSWRVHGNSHCHGPHAFDTFTFWRFRGPGVATTLDFGGAKFDYFLGHGGMACRDVLEPLKAMAVFRACP